MPNSEGRSSSKTRVLIVAADPIVGALVGLLLDPDRFDAVFPMPGERPEKALTRMRPPLVLVLDCDLEVARSDLFFARTAKTRATIVLFGSPGSGEILKEQATARGVPCVQLPTERGSLTDAIQAAIANAKTAVAWSIAATALLGASTLSRFVVRA